MFATPISHKARPQHHAVVRGRNGALCPRVGFTSLAASLVLVCAGGSASAVENSSPASSAVDSAARTKKNYVEARARFQAATNNSEAAWQFARACFDRAVAATNNADRAKMAEEGIAVSRRVVAREPGLIQSHYYLGMNLGQLADTKRNTGALKIVDEMEQEFKAARDLDERFDYAGPDRNLGLLYSQAPSVVSIGNRSKARQHLRRAVELAPDYPENRLNLIEAYLKWGDRSGAWREYKALEAVWPEAQKKLTGDAWAASWVQWEKRRSAIKKKLPEENVTVEPVRSPKQASE
jgi:tetratricopeptide (TPR) repeat protein